MLTFCGGKMKEEPTELTVRYESGYYIFFSGSIAPVGPGLFSQFHDHFTDGRTPWTGDQLVSRPLPKHRTTQTQNKHIPNIHALSGIRTHDPSVHASEDSSSLRPLGYCDRRLLFWGLLNHQVCLRFCVVVELGLWHWGKNVYWGYLSRRIFGLKTVEVIGCCIMRSFITCTRHRIKFEWWSRGGWDGQDM
jgi:hypothetical protein